MTLTEIAQRIAQHLKRFEADPALCKRIWTDGQGRERSNTVYWHTGARRGGAYVCVMYISYQGWISLKRADAETYLAWLDAGNAGSHWDALRAQQAP